MELSLVTLLLLLLGSASANFFEPFNVSYDHRALIIDGRRRMLISAGIHYPRATSEVFPLFVCILFLALNLNRVQ